MVLAEVLENVVVRSADILIVYVLSFIKADRKLFALLVLLSQLTYELKCIPVPSL